MALLVLFCITLCCLVGCQRKQFTYNTGEVTIDSKTIKVQVADKIPQILQGLSGRQSLAVDQGMLFVFPKSGIYDFWMKEMRFTLDIIWISQDQIVDLWQNAPLPQGENIPRYRPKEAAQYVLEVNAGVAVQNQWKIGDKVLIKLSAPSLYKN